MKDNHIEIKTDREHLLLIPEMYIGSMSNTEIEDFFLEEDKFVLKKIEYIPSLLKIISEIIDNSIDESIRSNFQYSNKISIDITDTSISIIDNGRGLPVKIISGTEMYMPEAAFTLARSGSNFKDKETKKEIGTHGIGSFATNVFSKKFEVTTYDGKKKFHMICKNNNDGSHKCKVSDSARMGTEIYFEPDLARFKLSKLTQSYKDVIKQRLIFLSISYPLIKFSFNGEKIKSLSENNFISMFGSEFESYKSENYFFALLPSNTDNFKFFTYVNGLHMSQGGQHVDIIMYEIVRGIRERLSKKHPEIKPGDIRNKLQLIVFFNNFTNPKFNSQTKEILTNTPSEIKEYMGEVAWDKICDKIYRNEAIIEPIVEIYKIKEEFKKRQDLKGLSSTKKISVEKYLPPIGEKKYLTLCEGDSAVSSTISILGRKEFGYFPLKGKPLNVIDGHVGKITTNEEIKNIISILGIDISKEVKEMNYENILIASDQDLDGILIRGLLLTFFYKYTPLLLKAGKIKYLKTPMIMLKKKGKIEHWFFNFNEYNTWLESNDVHEYEFKYLKGLGTWKKEDLQYIINKAGFDKFVETFELDKTAKESITHWMGSEFSDKRKEFLRGKEFDLQKL